MKVILQAIVAQIVDAVSARAIDAAIQPADLAERSDKDVQHTGGLEEKLTPPDPLSKPVVAHELPDVLAWIELQAFSARAQA
ncbi:hypothetical protein LMTR13_25735 [Bradyrhizobium icense]|uniref:Uncharacterized protein n=1 Tax=Bradyrhizobium icense TaxID=1274631 RepID=A0A1B1UJX1_9BRAD|nr:hypothetical protein LMTR13_25735 [Bradyrhizobium icense]